MILCLIGTTPAVAQGIRSQSAAQPIVRVASVAEADLRGLVLDELGRPLGGAVVSALGATTAFAISDPEGRFAFRSLPYGPYLVRAHLQGYVPARGRIIQVDQSTRGVSTLALTRLANADAPPEVLAAGVAPVSVDATSGDDAEAHDHGEVAWRLRHLKRSVLKQSTRLIDDLGDDSFVDTSLGGLSRAMGTPARVATSILSDLPISGEVNLLTRTSFDRPQDLFSVDTWMPRGIAFLSLAAPTSDGEWTMRGAMTQGDLSSWIVAGSYVRHESATHRYHAGLSYGMQRYLGANADALAAVTDGNRNVGSVFVYDNWSVNPRLTLMYGAKYARYDYLAQQGLMSPRLTATIHGDELKIRATVSRRSTAPGAEEFIPPSTGLWLPPERTFSHVSPRNGLYPERIDHYEISAERDVPGSIVIGVRAFRQNVDDQLVTLFGVAPPGTAAATVGHYYVASGGDVETRGWGVNVSRDVTHGLRASIDYTFAGANWTRGSSDTPMLSRVAASVVRDDAESIHDLTTSVESVLPVTETRVFVIYKINTRFADASASGPRAGTRFDVRLNQSLPFLNFSSAQWEMLVAVRNLFREELMDASMYDELLVVRPPKRILGGVTVRF